MVKCAYPRFEPILFSCTTDIKSFLFFKRIKSHQFSENGDRTSVRDHQQVRCFPSRSCEIIVPYNCVCFYVAGECFRGNCIREPVFDSNIEK
jgi:hypothetical protein